MTSNDIAEERTRYTVIPVLFWTEVDTTASVEVDDVLVDEPPHAATLNSAARNIAALIVEAGNWILLTLHVYR
jgi:hypothetical protein